MFLKSRQVVWIWAALSWSIAAQASIDGDGVVTPICSAEVKQRNIDLIDATVQELLQREDFQTAPIFRERVTRVLKETDPQRKLELYGEFIAVDSKDATALLEFIGARDHSIYVDEAARNLQLSPMQAEIIVNVLKENILKSVNR